LKYYWIGYGLEGKVKSIGNISIDYWIGYGLTGNIKSIDGNTSKIYATKK